MPTLKTNAFYKTAYEIIRFIFPIVTYPYVSRILGPQGIGKVSYAQTIAEYFIIFSLLGIPLYGSREISKSRINPQRFHQVFSELVSLCFILSFLAFFLYSIFIFIFPSIAAERSLHWLFSLTVIFSWANMDWFYQGIENYKYISIRNFIIRLLSLVLIFLIIKKKEDYIVYGLIWVLGTLVSSISNFSYSFKFASLQIKYLKLKDLLNHLIRSLPTTVLSWMGFIYATIDTIMLGAMIQDDKYSVGLYTVAGRIIRIVLSIIISISTVLLPRFSYLSELKDYDHLNDILRKGIYLLMYIAIPCFIGIFCISDNIILIFAGNKFENSITTLKILSCELIFVSIRSIFSNYLYAISKEKKLVIITILSLLLAIILNALFIPRFKQNGAATATIICMFIESFLLIRASRDIKFHSKEWKIIIKIVVVNILFLLGLLILVFSLKQYHLIYSTLLIIFSSVLLYLILSIIFRLEPYLIISEWVLAKVKEAFQGKKTL